MKCLLSAILAGALFFGFASPAPATGSECPIEGELVQWIADYCMWMLETDDEIAAGDCIARELAASATDECSAKRRYKQAMCELARARGTTVASGEQCLADRGFMGSTVRHRGVGARPQDPADGFPPARR